MEAGMIVQMDIVWRTLCVLFKRRRNVCQTEIRGTYSSNRDVPMHFNGVSVPGKLRCSSGHELCYTHSAVAKP